MSSTNTTLSALVSSTPHLLAYSIPLLLFSIPFTLAGTFLILDRTRSFPPSYTPVLPATFDGPKKKHKIKFALRGGVGGIASGYVFGLHLSTFLSLLVPSISSSAPLSPNSFLAVWVLSCVLAIILGGRYKYCALLFSAVSGGALLALAISLIIHPPLLPRQVLVALLSLVVPIVILLFCLPRLSNFLHPTLRVATACSGAFSLVLSIALLAHISAWANVWERLWLHDGENWGSSKEKGLSAAYCILTCIGIASDWALNRWLGECPDEKWDNYLAKYAANLPNNASRAGIFKPFTHNTFWSRFLPSPTKNDVDFFDSSSDSHKPPRNSVSKDAAGLLSNDDFSQDPLTDFSEPRYSYDSLPTSPAFLKKTRLQGAKFIVHKKIREHRNIARTRKQPIKFGANLSSDSDDDSDPHSVDAPNNVRPWIRQKASTNSSSPTLVEETTRSHLALSEHEHGLNDQLSGMKKGLPNINGSRSEVVDYSDYEEDLGSPIAKSDARKQETGWSPGFLKRHTSSSIGGSGNGSGVSPITTNGRKNHVGVMPMGAVPATPSLIKALDRISVAQREAFGPGGLPPASSHNPLRANSYDAPHKAKLDSIPIVKELDNDSDDDQRPGNSQGTQNWEEFWSDVKRKAEI